MSSFTQRLVDNFPAVRAVLTGVVGWNSNSYYAKHFAKIFQPIPKSRPCSIGYRLRQSSILDHITHLQVLIGDQVVRLDYASCQLHSKIFTLPTDLKVLPAQTVSCFGSILRAFLSTRKSSCQPLEPFFRLPEMTWVLDSLPIRIGVEVPQANVQPDGFACWLSFLNSFLIKAKLNVVPIGTTNNSHPLDLLQLIEMQITGSPHLEASSLKPIGEGDSSPIVRQLPACCFVFNRAMRGMFLEAWETCSTLLAFLAVVIEPRNCRPSSFSRSLSSLRIEFSRPRKLLGKDSAIGTQLILPGSKVLHPVLDATIANKTRSTNSFIQPFILLFCALKFCLKYKHDYANTTSVILAQK